MKTIGSQSFGVAIAAMAVVMLTSCSLVNPHVKWKPPEGKVPPATKLTLDYGIQYAENAKAAYMSALGYQSQLASWLGIGLIPVAAAALGLGMTGQSPAAITALGLTAASGYAVGTWLYSKPNQRAWVAGYNATTCAVDAISPLLYVEKKKDEMRGNKKTLDEALVSVTEKINSVRLELGKIEPKPSADLVELRKLGEQRVTEAEKLLTDSRDTRRAAEKMLLETETAGETLKQTVDRISGKVSQQIVENAPDIQTLASMIGGLAQSYGQFVTVPEGLRPASPDAVKAQAGAAASPAKNVASLGNAIADLQTQMLKLQNATISVADIVNLVTASKPIDTLKACGVTVEQIAQPITVEPSGPMELQAGKAATVGRVIRGGSAPYAVALQGDGEGLVVRQTEPFGPAFTVQITDKTPAKEYSIYISDKAGQKLFIPLVVKSGAPAPPPAGSQTANLRKDNLQQAAAALNTSKASFALQDLKVNVTILKADFESDKLAVDLEIRAQSGEETTDETLNSIKGKDDEITDEILRLKILRELGINNKGDIYVRSKNKPAN